MFCVCLYRLKYFQLVQVLPVLTTLLSCFVYLFNESSYQRARQTISQRHTSKKYHNAIYGSIHVPMDKSNLRLYSKFEYFQDSIRYSLLYFIRKRNKIKIRFDSIRYSDSIRYFQFLKIRFTHSRSRGMPNHFSQEQYESHKLVASRYFPWEYASD